MNPPRIVVSGMGVISAAGTNIAETLKCFESGAQNTCKVNIFETSLDQPVFEVRHIPKDRVGEQMRTLRLAMHATKDAMADACFDHFPNANRVGVCMGTTVACQLNDIDFYGSYRKTKSAPMGSVDRYLKGNVSQAVATAIGAKGPSLTVANACSSGADAIGVAFTWLRTGICDIAVAGGADELSRIPLCGFNALGIISDEP
ncbi:MAG: beta-ketoacyl-[acyl-carrier-protein] synthase family protein, partial [Lentisphaerae bacterium]|nr:beta-ketoacyl-[acyl-carrier-protein] synthase family protein [Lentisphaerota bacterium]